ncbi:nucleotidyltransferase domain-containing protein, partial [Ilumatobacter sp.]|uniref:[protein-PII] uridylyltransferase family protein n=1 Tax=Ilumatobacter sp. TaxID=1967498 RepID=UPI003C64E553
MTPDDRRSHFDLAAEVVPEGVHRGREYCTTLARITDDWVIGLFEEALAAHPTKYRVALLAVGGYGRGELAPYSDLDLLLVHNCKPRKVVAEIEPLASALWYPLWDSGVKLGHAVRRVDEQLDLVDGDLDSATALLSARFLAGDDEIAAEVTRRGRKSWESQRSEYLTALRARMKERQAASADVAYRLEPDLKNGHGGLRDVQTVWWAMAGGLDVIDQDLDDLDECYDTLLRARIALHLTTDRAGDVMRLEDQDAIAATGEWSDADAMMADVATAGRNVAWLCDENWNRAIERDPQDDRAIAPGVVLRN